MTRCPLYLLYAGQPSEAPMGINIAIPPSRNSTSLSKSCITNASFRTKKLPGKNNLSLFNFGLLNEKTFW